MDRVIIAQDKLEMADSFGRGHGLGSVFVLPFFGA